MKIIDCTTYYNEDLMLEVRFNIMNKYVDKFIVVESKYQHSGNKKKLNFNINKFSEFKKKIIYKIVEEEPKNIIYKEKNNVLYEEEIDKSGAASLKGENKTKISENTEAINQSEQKSCKNNVFLSKTHQNSEKYNSLKDVKIDLELKPENEASVNNTDSSTRSSISELKKELMSLSELIKSTPAKVKSSTEVQNP